MGLIVSLGLATVLVLAFDVEENVLDDVEDVKLLLAVREDLRESRLYFLALVCNYYERAFLNSALGL